MRRRPIVLRRTTPQVLAHLPPGAVAAGVVVGLDARTLPVAFEAGRGPAVYAVYLDGRAVAGYSVAAWSRLIERGTAFFLPPDVAHTEADHAADPRPAPSAAASSRPADVWGSPAGASRSAA